VNWAADFRGATPKNSCVKVKYGIFGGNINFHAYTFDFKSAWQFNNYHNYTIFQIEMTGSASQFAFLCRKRSVPLCLLPETKRPILHFEQKVEKGLIEISATFGRVIALVGGFFLRGRADAVLSKRQSGALFFLRGKAGRCSF
jgi:hypothetical protein